MIYGLKELDSILEISNLKTRNDLLRTFDINSFERIVNMPLAIKMTDNDMMEILREPINKESLLTFLNYEMDLVDKNVFKTAAKKIPEIIPEIDRYRKRADMVESMIAHYDCVQNKDQSMTEGERLLFMTDGVCCMIKEQHYVNIVRAVNRTELVLDDEITFILRDEKNYYAMKRCIFGNRDEAILFHRVESLLHKNSLEIKKAYGVNSEYAPSETMNPEHGVILRELIDRYKKQILIKTFNGNLIGKQSRHREEVFSKETTRLLEIAIQNSLPYRYVQ